MQLSQDVNPHTKAARQTQVRHSISIIAMKATADPLKEKQGCPLLAHITHTLCKVGTSRQLQNKSGAPSYPIWSQHFLYCPFSCHKGSTGSLNVRCVSS